MSPSAVASQLDRAARCTTGAFAERLRQDRTAEIEGVKNFNMTTTLRALDTALVNVSGPDKITLLCAVVVDINATTKTSKITPYQVDVTKVGGVWRLAGLSEISN